MSLNISITKLPVLLSGENDFFNINAECSVDNCSILILIMIVLIGTLFAIGLFIIIRRIRSRNSRIYVQVRAVKVKNIKKELENKENQLNDESMEFYDIMNKTNTKKQSNQEVSNKTKEENDESILKSNISTGKPKENEVYHVNLENELKDHLEEQILLKENKKNQLKLLAKNESDSSKGSKKNFFNEKLQNKSQMFGEDSSIQYEGDSFNNEILNNPKVLLNEESEISGNLLNYLKDNNDIKEIKDQPPDQNLVNLTIKKPQKTEEENRLKTIIEENEANVETIREVKNNINKNV